MEREATVSTVAVGRDIVMRLPILFVTAYFLQREWDGLLATIARHPFFDGDWAFLAHLVAHVGTIIFIALLWLFHSIRRRPLRQFASWEPKITAALGMSFAYLLLLLPQAPPHLEIDLLASAILTLGNFLCIVAVTALGRSLSIMPEARKLVTHGLYRYVRHPLYLAELVADVGIFLLYRSWPALVILIIVFLLQIRRMDWEEKILGEAFPEYAEYRRNSWRLLPGVY